MSDDTYNGWTNRETWAIQLHLGNNEGDYRLATEKAQGFVAAYEDDDAPETREGAIFDMANWIEEWTREAFDSVLYPEDGPPTEEARLLISDVGSFWRADFYEIAEGWISEALENVKS